MFSKDRESILDEHCGEYSCGYFYTCQFQHRYSKGCCCILNAQPLWKVHITLCSLTSNSSENRSGPFFSWQVKSNIKGPLVKLAITLKQDTLYSASQTFLLADPFWFWKITTDSHILAHVNLQCPDNTYPKLKICISEVTSDSYKYIPAVYVIMHYMIWPWLNWPLLASRVQGVS